MAKRGTSKAGNTDNCPWKLPQAAVGHSVDHAQAGLSNCTGGVCFGLEYMVSFRDSASLPRTKAGQRRETLVGAIEKQP